MPRPKNPGVPLQLQVSRITQARLSGIEMELIKRADYPGTVTKRQIIEMAVERFAAELKVQLKEEDLEPLTEKVPLFNPKTPPPLTKEEEIELMHDLFPPIKWEPVNLSKEAIDKIFSDVGTSPFGVQGGKGGKGDGHEDSGE